LLEHTLMEKLLDLVFMQVNIEINKDFYGSRSSGCN